MPLLSKKQILEAQDIVYQDISCPEWGGDVRIQAMTGKDRAKFEQMVTKVIKQGNRVSRDVVLQGIQEKIIILCAIDEQGNKLFDEADMEALSAKSNAPIVRLAEAARKLSGLDETELEEMAKN